MLFEDISYFLLQPLLHHSPNHPLTALSASFYQSAVPPVSIWISDHQSAPPSSRNRPHLFNERNRTTISRTQLNCSSYPRQSYQKKVTGNKRPLHARMEGIQALNGGATSPTSGGRPGTGGGYKRKRSGAEFESSPGTGGEGDEEEAERRRQPGVKRACNECRQQKVSHSTEIDRMSCDATARLRRWHFGI
jgi:hypothetical protein